MVICRPGNYTITETQPTGWADGKESLGTSGGGIGSDLFSNINLPANFDGTNYNFGEIRLGQIGGKVYADGMRQRLQQWRARSRRARHFRRDDPAQRHHRFGA